MEFRVDKASEFPIYLQLKEQIRYYLLSGALTPGNKLPPPKDLAAYLRINRNTVIVAYKELEREGLIVTKHGQGTYLAENPPAIVDKSNRELVAVAQTALAQAEAMGFTARDLLTVVYGQTVLGRKDRTLKLIFVECNQPDLDFYVTELAADLTAEVEGCLLAELPDRLASESVRAADLIVTTFFHIEDVRSLAEAAGKKVFALMAIPALDVLLQIGQLPPGTRVGVVCAEAQGAASMRSALAGAGASFVQIDHAGFDQPESIERLFRWAQVIIGSRVVIDRVQREASPAVKVIEFAKVLEKASIGLLKDYIATI